MELSLSLGDSNTSSKQLGFLAKNDPNDHMNITSYDKKKNNSSRAGVVGLGFCMALGTINSNGPHHKSMNQNIDDDADHNSSSEDTIDDDINQRLRLHFLPLAPPPSNHSRSLRWSSDIGSSDNGSSGNAGLPTAVARVPKAGEEVSSPNSVASAFQMDFISILRGNTGNKRDHSAVENDVVEAERASSRASDEDENGINTRKKLRLSKEQSAYLEDSFKEHNTLNPKQKLTLAKQLNLRPRQVEVWFQNRRARTKLKQTEVDCEYMKRCWERLREENRRLQKELGEVRALKSTNSKPFYMQLPPTTLTMCPSCERVATTSHRS